jgi:mono/diheme cytochrome c family protein
VFQIALGRIAGVVIAITANGLAFGEDDRGRALYLSSCAECHGIDAKGGGTKSAKLRVKPPDLTRLARRSHGLFSPAAVHETIDGRTGIRSHRTSEMPIWGCRQGKPRERWQKAIKQDPNESFLDLPCDPEELVQSRIRAVVEYLRTIQAK